MSLWKQVRGTITTGGVAQQLVPVRLGSTALLFQNTSAEDLFLSISGDATTDDLRVAANGDRLQLTASEAPGNAISVLGATTASSYVVWYDT